MAAPDEPNPRVDGRHDRPQMRSRVFAALCGVAIVVATFAVGTTALVGQQLLVGDAHALLSRECELLVSVLDGPESDASTLDLEDMRLTIVAPDGQVTYDSAVPLSELSNHADRPEIVSARESGKGSSERPSETVGNVSIYEARMLDNGEVLRLSTDREGVLSMLMADFPLLVALLAALIVASWLVARWLSAAIVRPILEIDPKNTTAEPPYEELAPLVARLAHQQAKVDRQLEELAAADAQRREFTANVTHELKTPIASISGAAELMGAGIVQQQDVPEFANRIYDEAKHLTTLVNDILMLSRLDESERAGDRSIVGKVEPVDLRSTALDIVDRLAVVAGDRNVSLHVSGPDIVVDGLPRLLDEMIYNLCDNAIRYNREGGHVDVLLSVEDGCPRVAVRDTGVGIDPSQHAKVFERFYRVDPSRSRELGGTGLGLAIVKHAATFHGGTVSVDSSLGKGTTITVSLPAAILLNDPLSD